MPTYDYRCKSCGHEMDMFQSMSERPKRKCPACGKNQLERLIGMGGGLLFKGQGAWQTDYRSKSYTEGAKKDQEAAKSASSESKGDADKPSQAAKPSKDPKAKAAAKKQPRKKS